MGDMLVCLKKTLWRVGACRGEGGSGGEEGDELI